MHSVRETIQEQTARWRRIALRMPRLAMLLWMALAATTARGLSAADALDGAISIKSQEAVAHVPVVPVKSTVPWAAEPIRIDGELEDWSGVASAVVLEGDAYSSWFRGDYQGIDDLSAEVRLCRDDDHLYLALEIHDDRLPATSRVSFAFAGADSELITGWRDVGERYGADDVHTIFVLGEDGSVGMHWAHLQERMDRSVVQNSFGSETERRAMLEEGGPDEVSRGKIVAKTSRRIDAGRSITTLEVAFPWTTLAPYVPVSYAPLKFNVAVQDEDGEAAAMARGAVAWTPGLIGTYSAAHFPTLTFTPPAGREDVDTFAQVPTASYLDQKVTAGFSFYNHGAARSGKLELLAKGKVVDSAEVSLTPRYSRHDLDVHSEQLDAGKTKLSGRLMLQGGASIEIPVHVPTLEGRISVRKLADVASRIAQLEQHVEVLSGLYEQVKAKGLDTTYPLAYLTLQKMFIDRSRIDLDNGDAARVLRNTAYLEDRYAHAKRYMESILKNPDAQLAVSDAFNPDELTIKEGYYFDGDRPVFLWGPCVFWYLRDHQPTVIDLGFNSVTPEVPQDATNQEVRSHLENWYRAGVSINAAVRVLALQATGADAAKLGLLKQHPDLANVDGNNFMPFVVQHPLVRPQIVDGFEMSIGFWSQFPGIRSYWLWNEPWYTNYSERTRKDFIAQYLKPKYKRIAALNKRWSTDYASFDDIKLITRPDPNNYAPWYDFQQFRDNLLADFWTLLDETAKSIDPSKPTHVKFMAASLHSGNMEQYQQPFDIAGHDGSISDRDIVFLDYMRSLFPDRPLVNTEIHIGYAGRKAVDMVAWRLALHGLADGNWWCWHSNPGFSDSIGNAESMYALTISGLDLQRLFDPYMYALNRKPSNVAVLFPDVVERRSDVTMVRIRMELAPALYALGVRPFYAAESRVAQGQLSNHDLLLAGESDYVKDSTYQAVVDYVKDGGTVIVTRGGFAHNEYGDPRDTSELIKLDAGKTYGDKARIYSLGDGQVICIDAIEALPDIVTDGGQALRTSPLAENQSRRWVYQQVVDRAMADLELRDAVRIVANNDAADDPGILYGLDWRSAKMDGGYVLAVLPYRSQPPFKVKLETDRPIRRLVDLITGKQIDPARFELTNGPNLLRIELEP